MYNILKNRIHTGGFKLSEIQSKAKKLYAMGELTDAQLDELMNLSQQNAAPEAERPEVMEMLSNLSERVSAIEKKMAQSLEPETPEVEAWKPWDGVSSNYQLGAVVSHNSKLWKSVFNGQNVWEPGTPGTESLWIEYIEEVANNV